MIELKHGAEEVTATVRTLKTGLIPFEVVAVNPDMVALKELGIDVDKEPVYTGTYEQGSSAGKDYVDIKFILKADHTQEGFEDLESENYQRLNFRFRKGKFISGSLKTQYINIFGKTCWSDQPGVFNKYFDPTGVMESVMGLESFCSFIFAWCNMSNEDPIINQDSLNKLLKGDVSGLRKLIKEMQKTFKETGKKYVVKCLQGVSVAPNGNTYNQIFNKHFCKHFQGEGFMRKFVDKVEKDGKQYGAFSTPAYPVIYSYDVEVFDEDKAMRELAESRGMSAETSASVHAIANNIDPMSPSMKDEEEDPLPF